MVYYKTSEEIELIRTSCLIVSKVLAHVGSLIRPGMTADVIDREAETLIRDHGAVPSFKGYGGFPATLCVSVNEIVVHGIPHEKQVFGESDVISVDCGAYLNGFHGDSAYTFVMQGASPEVVQLCEVTNQSLYKGINVAIEGNKLGDIGFAIQNYTEGQHGYGVVRELVGHGVGRELHESPQVPNYGKRGRGLKLKDGLVIAIEPMINMGKHQVEIASDGWSIITIDKKVSAHYEHTVAVGKGKADILSDHSLLYETVASNDNLFLIK
jgi:methionyl aminopeptidase